jgi:hypothetical protein
VLPLLSLAFALASAWWMERTPERARVVAAASVVAFAASLLISAAVRYLDERATTPKMRAARFATVGAMQMMLQQGLAFVWPFVWRSSVHDGVTWAHVPFCLVLAAISVVVFWDPCFAWLVRRPTMTSLVTGVVVTAAALVVVPMLGGDNRTAVFAACVAFMSLGCVAALRSSRWSRVMVTVVVVAMVTVAMFRGALLPPVPLRLGRVVFSAAVVDREPKQRAHAGAPVFCFSEIEAPLGVNDTLVHEWTLNHEPVQRVVLAHEGGRRGGYRTWSVWSQPRAGLLRCRVETTSGQALGAVQQQLSRDDDTR